MEQTLDRYQFRGLKNLLFLGLAAWSLSYVKVPAPPEPATASLPQAYADYHRAEDRTFLSFPERYTVFVAEDYARFIKDHPPSEFPYFSSIRQFWDSYRDMCRVADSRYKFDTNYQIIVVSKGISMSLELFAKGVYENTVGRLAEMAQKHGRTTEEMFAANTAAAYAGFVRVYPWYDFNYTERLIELWRQTGLQGQDPVRKAERKFVLSAGYAGKGAYAWVARKAVSLIYPPDSPFTVVQVQNAGDDLFRYNHDIRLISSEKGHRLIAVPRSAFTGDMLRLAKANVLVQEVAGNSGTILITLITGKSWEYGLAEGKVVFTQPVLADPEHKRIGVAVPVSYLGYVLGMLPGNVGLEHIYDY